MFAPGYIRGASLKPFLDLNQELKTSNVLQAQFLPCYQIVTTLYPMICLHKKTHEKSGISLRY